VVSSILEKMVHHLSPDQTPMCETVWRDTTIEQIRMLIGLATVLFRISEWIESHQGDEPWQRYTVTTFDVKPSALH
jgi:hypothetical protein